MLPLQSNISLNVGDYYIAELIQASPAHTVALARNLTLDRNEVLKIFHEMPGESNEHYALEVRARASLRHEGLPRLLAAGAFEAGGWTQQALALEFVEGRSVADTLRDNGRMEPLRVYRLALQLLNIYSEIHGVGMLLDALGTQDLLIVDGPSGESLRLSTYGLVHQARDRGDCSVSELMTFQPYAAAPERFARGGCSPQGDLFSVGVWMYEALSGHLPYGESVGELMRAYRRCERPVWLAERCQIPAALAEIVHRALQIEAEDRFASAASMRRALLRIDEARLDTSAGSPSVPGEPMVDPGIPQIWVFTDGPEFRHPNVAQLLSELEQRYELSRLDEDGRRAAAAAVCAGERGLPWVVLFGDLHVILEDELLFELKKHGELTRVLVSTHPNLDMMRASVSACGLDSQLLVDTPTPELMRQVNGMVERASQILARRGAVYGQLQDALEKIQTLKTQLEAKRNDPPARARTERLHNTNAPLKVGAFT